MAFSPPDVLVLGGGGVLGEAWMSALLAGIEDATGFDTRGCEGYVGTSAGSIVAAALAGGVRPDARLGALPEPPDPDVDDHLAGPGVTTRALRAGMASAAAPLASLALPTIAPGGALVRRLALNRLPEGTRSLGGLGRRIDSLGAHFDGRLTVSAVDLDSGRRVMFGEPDAPEATVGQAVEASCAIPGYFRPVRIGGRAYVDGGVWSPTNMDTVSVARGTRVLCLNPTGSMSHSITSPMGAIGLASRSLARVEALTLERRGARVQLVSPDAGSLEAIGPSLMEPGRREQVIAAAVEQGRRIGRGSA
jgi:NTE family protein